MANRDTTIFRPSDRPGRTRDAAARAAITRALQDLDGEARLAAIARLTADGELPPGIEPPTETDPASDRGVFLARVAFEERLRAACRRTHPMHDSAEGVPAVPEGLASRVLAAIRASNITSTPVGGRQTAGDQAATTSRSFWASGGLMKAVTERRGALTALAAALVLGVTFFAFRGGNPTGNPTGNSTGNSDEMSAQAFARSLSTFLADEHDRIASSPSAAERKLTVRTISSVSDAFVERLGARPSIPEGGAGRVSFVGAGDCSLPGCKIGGAAHLQYVVTPDGARVEDGAVPPEGSVLVSVFITKSPEGLLTTNGRPLTPGRTYEIDCERAGVGEMRMTAWTDGTLVYFAVAERCEMDGCGTVLDTLELPQPGPTDLI